MQVSSKVIVIEEIVNSKTENINVGFQTRAIFIFHACQIERSEFSNLSITSSINAVIVVLGYPINITPDTHCVIKI